MPAPRSQKAIRSRRACAARFVEYLVSIGVVAPPAAEPPPPPSRFERLSADYGDWLRLQPGPEPVHDLLLPAVPQAFPGLPLRGGARRPERHRAGERPCLHCPAAPAVPGARAGGGDEGGASSPDVPVHVRHRADPAATWGPCVPTIAARSRHGASCHLSVGEVRRLVAAVNGEGAAGRRDRAVMLLLARLGLRSQEIVAIRLDDINWARRRDPGPRQARTP